MAVRWLVCPHYRNPWTILSSTVNPSKSVTSATIIGNLERMLCTHGRSQLLKTDIGPQFTSEEFGTFLKTNGIQHRTSMPLWPQANGKVERQNRSLLKALKIAQAEKKNLACSRLSVVGDERKGARKKRGRTKALPYFFSRSPFFRSQLPRAWNRLRRT